MLHESPVPPNRDDRRAPLLRAGLADVTRAAFLGLAEKRDVEQSSTKGATRVIRVSALVLLCTVSLVATQAPPVGGGGGPVHYWDPRGGYMVLGGQTNGQINGLGWVDNNPQDSIVLPRAVPAGTGLIVVVSMYAWDTAPSNISDDGANVWTLATQQPFTRFDDGSISQFYTVAQSAVSQINIDMRNVSSPTRDAGRWYRWAVIVEGRPNATLGFFTAPPSINLQAPVIGVTAGSVTPALPDALTVFAFSNRGHAEDLEPVTPPQGYTCYIGTENSQHQSGSWCFRLESSMSAVSPTVALASLSERAHSTVASFNLGY